LIHAACADLARRTEYLARVQGSNPLGSVVRSMEQAVSGKAVPGALRVVQLGGLSSIATRTLFFRNTLAMPPHVLVLS
jgi:hypothetical protein